MVPRSMSLRSLPRRVVEIFSAVLVAIIAASSAGAVVPPKMNHAEAVAGLVETVRPQSAQFRINIGGGGGGIGVGGGGRRFGGARMPGSRVKPLRVRPSGAARTRGPAAASAAASARIKPPRVRVVVPPRGRPGGNVVGSAGKGPPRPPRAGKEHTRPDGYPRCPRPPVIVTLPPTRVPPRVIVTEEPPRWRPGTRIVRTPPLRAVPPVMLLPPLLVPPSPPPAHVATPPAATPPTGPQIAPLPESGDIWPNELVVFVDTAAQPAGTDLAIAQTHNLQRVSFEDIALAGQRLVLYRISDGRTVPAVVQALAGDGRVALVAPNYRYVTSGETKRDGVVGGRVEPASAAVGAGASALQYALAKLRIPEARATATGRDVTIAVIDSGIDGDHPALAGALTAQADFTDGRGEAVDAHGTAIAGVIRAKGEVEGVAPAARVVAARAFFRTKGEAKAQSSTYMIARAIYWALAQEARVLNMSFAGPKDAAVAKAVGDALGRGVVLVAAAGNNGDRAPPAFPAAYPGVIAVTAIDTADRLYDKANRGTYVALAAPGVDVLVVTPKAGYGFDQGTSIAAAHVSGVIALMIERQPTLVGDEVRRILAEHAVDLGEPGRDQLYGAGRVDAYAAIGAIRSALATKAR